MAVKSSHFVDGKNSNAAEGTCGNREYLALCNVCRKLSVSCGLETEEGYLRGNDIALESTSCDIRLLIRLQTSVHDELILHLAGGKLLCGGVSAVEAHECVCMSISELALDVILVNVRRNSVVDIKQSYRIIGNALSYVLAYSSPDIYLAGNGNASSRKAAVNIAGNEAELCLERRPALVCEDNKFSFALVLLSPVKESYLILSKLGKNAGHLVALSQLLSHFGNDLFDPCIACMSIECGKQVKLGVFLYLSAQIVDSCNRCVAGKEVLGTGAKGDDLEL